MSHLRRVAATLAATAVALTPSLLGSAHAATPTQLPDQDPFYQYGAGGTPGTPPADSASGDVLGTRSVGLTLTDLSKALSNSTNPATFPATATQLLYRTQNETGAPSQTVTTVIRPAGASRGVVAYLSYYDGLGDSCDPSYTLQSTTASAEKAIIGTLVESGYTVTVPDFEGEGLDWAAGHEAGWGTLDAIRATEKALGLPAATTPVALMGYSGGSIAGDWASELAPSYASELDLAGTAIGGVPVNLGDVMGYVDSDADADRNAWFGVIPAAMVSLERAYGSDKVDFAAVESTEGQEIAGEVADECIGDFAKDYPNLHVSDLLDSSTGYTSLLDVPGVPDIVNGLVMGTGGTPRMPMLIVQGRSSDGEGDGVMVTDDVAALAQHYRSEGVPVTYTELTGQDHSAAGTSFVLSALGFLDRVLPAPAQPSQPKTAVHAKLKSHSAGRKDVLVVTAKGATGAKVKVYRMHHGHRAKAGHGVINKHGKATIKVVDHNGSAKTRYRATVAATATTLAATTKVVKQR